MRTNSQETALQPLTATPTLSGSTRPAPSAAAVAASGQADGSSGELPISHYTWLMGRNAWKILAFVLVFVLATAFVSIRLTPEYESTATLYVDRGEAKNVVGQDQQASYSQSVDADTFLASQMKLIQSDAVVRPLAEKFGLLEREIQIRPGIDTREKIAKVVGAPIVLKGLRITRPAGTFILQIAYRTTDPNIAAEVANGLAQSYIEHVYDIRIRSSASLSRFMTRQLDELRATTEASASKLAALEQELQMLNPEEKTNILAARLQQLNTEYTKVQAERVKAQSMYEAMTGGSVEAALTSAQSEDLRGIVKRLNEAQERFADTAARFGANHPEYARQAAIVAELERQMKASIQHVSDQIRMEYSKAKNQEALLLKEVSDTKADYDHLNSRFFEFQRAKQDADADRLLYDELVKKIREDEINSGFQNNQVRLADPARAGAKPVFPNIPLNLTVAFFLSLTFAAFVVIAADRIDSSVKSPEEITRGLRARVIGLLPDTRKATLLALHADSAPGDDDPTAQLRSAQRPFEEAVRALRNTILLSDIDRPLRSILMTSAVPAEGKSTVASFLAVAHAQQGRRTLLVDADTRRPSLHRLFRLKNTTGLVTAMEESRPWREFLVQPDPGLELFLLMAGPSNGKSADRVGQWMTQLISEALAEFDLVVVDAPPLLGFAEPLQMAVATDGVVVVTRAGRTDRASLAAVLSTLHDLRANLLGVVMNGVNRNLSRSYGYYGNYNKYYGGKQSAPSERA